MVNGRLFLDFDQTIVNFSAHDKLVENITYQYFLAWNNSVNLPNMIRTQCQSGWQQITQLLDQLRSAEIYHQQIRSSVQDINRRIDEVLNSDRDIKQVYKELSGLDQQLKTSNTLLEEQNTTISTLNQQLNIQAEAFVENDFTKCLQEYCLDLQKTRNDADAFVKMIVSGVIPRLRYHETAKGTLSLIKFILNGDTQNLEWIGDDRMVRADIAQKDVRNLLSSYLEQGNISLLIDQVNNEDKDLGDFLTEYLTTNPNLGLFEKISITTIAKHFVINGCVDAEQLKVLIDLANQANYSVTVVSRNSFPEAVKFIIAYLSEKKTMSGDIQAFCNYDIKDRGEMINAARSQLFQENPAGKSKTGILVDDSSLNVSSAKAKGYEAFLVAPQSNLSAYGEAVKYFINLTGKIPGPLVIDIDLGKPEECKKLASVLQSNEAKVSMKFSLDQLGVKQGSKFISGDKPLNNQTVEFHGLALNLVLSNDGRFLIVEQTIKQAAGQSQYNFSDMLSNLDSFKSFVQSQQGMEKIQQHERKGSEDDYSSIIDGGELTISEKFLDFLKTKYKTTYEQIMQITKDLKIGAENALFENQKIAELFGVHIQHDDTDVQIAGAQGHESVDGF